MTNEATERGFRAKVRMYRQGLGDCFLVTLPRSGAERPFYMMIDCGVILGTADPATMMTQVAQDIEHTTGGHVDVLVATHEHWDHLSGFVQALADLRKITFGEVWLSWAEDPNDPDAKALLDGRRQALRALALSATHLQMLGADASAEIVTNFLDNFGEFGVAGRTTADAMTNLKGLASIRYCDPESAPVVPDGTSVKIYVLGPPRDGKMLRKLNPSSKDPETYGLAAAQLYSVLTEPSDSQTFAPFTSQYAIPTSIAKTTPFFRQHYWPSGLEAESDAPAWRRIDDSWLDASATELAIQLDNLTNNTSLVLAIELHDGGVMLFPADAQVGNWLSWQTLEWKADGSSVTGPDLLKRCVFYKVGHHGSHNATLRAEGLELMDKLETAMIPVDHAMAVKKRWTHMPLPELVQRLGEKAHDVIRIDDETTNAASVTEKSDLFYEVTL